MKSEFISAVQPGWLDQEFLPAIRAKVLNERQPIIWILAESSIEANYLLEKVRSWAIGEEEAFDLVQIEPNDPFLLWDALLGNASEEGILHGANSIIGVWNGCFIPLEFLASRSAHLRRTCSGSNVSLLVPIFPNSREILKDCIDEEEVIEIPRFHSFPENRRVALLVQLIAASMPGINETDRLWLANELVQANPGSRAEAENWIQYYSGNPDASEIIRNFQLPPIERLPRLPPPCPSHNQLMARFTATQFKLDRSNDIFQRWIGRPLIRAIGKPIVEPFQSSDSLWWFVALVSALYRQLVDGVEPAFNFLSDFTVADRIVIASDKDPFFQVLRTLRTAFQHGLQPGSRTDATTLSQVRSWFLTRCGRQQPMRCDWRTLASALLNEWDRATDRLLNVLTHLSEVAKASLAAQLRLYERRLAKSDWRMLLGEAVSEINPDLDIELLLSKHLSSLQRDAQAISVGYHQYLDAARLLAKNVVIKETSRCPVGAADLQARGYQPGQIMGLALSYVEGVWRLKPEMTREELFEVLGLWQAGSRDAAH